VGTKDVLDLVWKARSSMGDYFAENYIVTFSVIGSKLKFSIAALVQKNLLTPRSPKKGIVKI